MKDSPRSNRPISRKVTWTVIATVIERSRHKSMRKRSAELGVLHLTMFGSLLIAASLEHHEFHGRGHKVCDDA